MKIDFVSDVSCPWCVIGLKSLQHAIARLDGEVQVELQFQPFELNPQMGAEGEDITEHLGRKYGSTPEQSAANRESIRQRGLAVGFEFRMERRARIYNTFDAHRLLLWAHTQADGPARQLALKQALFEAYFTAGDNPGDHAVLLRLVAAVGLDAVAAAEILAGDGFAAEVRAEEAYWQGAGIQAVPAVIIDGRHLIQGGQPPEVFEQALRRIANSARQLPQ